MKVMVLVKANADSEAGIMPPAELFRAMTDFNEQLAKAGVMLSGEGLLPSSHAKRVRCSGRDRKVIDGPFAESKELLAGFWIWQVKSMDEAVEWLKKSPFEEGELEIRQIAEVADFGDAIPPDVVAREKALRDAGKM